MEDLILVRHGESIGNQNKIIQGLSDFSLSENGKENVFKLVKENSDLLLSKTNIISSPLKRCAETSKILAKGRNIPITYDDLLVEFSAGILDGMSKEEAKSKYPEYLKIWSSRGDLDLIPNATKGRCLQARVLMFLEQFIDKAPNNIIVSHAGFLRCLINTVRGNPRTLAQNLDHNVIHRLNDLFSSIGIKEHTIAKNSKVLEFETFDDKYILKKVNRILTSNDINEKKLLEYLKKHNINVPTIYLMANRGEYALKSLEYKSGINYYDDISDIRLKNTLNELYLMQEALVKYDGQQEYEVVDMINHLKTNIKLINDEKIKKIGLDILSNEYFLNRISSDRIALVHDDLHRANILYDNDEVVFLDFEGVKRYPITYQLASHIAASYILNNPDFNICNILEKWPICVNYEYLTCLIKYRLYDGLIYFQNKIENSICCKDDYELREKYIKSLTKIK